MGKYDQILEYISYFELASNEYGNWVVTPNTLPYIVYEDRLSSFMRCISESDLVCVDYLSKIDMTSRLQLTDKIESADFELLKAMLTYYNRQERFQEGLCSVAAQNGILLRLLKRLKTILKEKSNEGIVCQV